MSTARRAVRTVPAEPRVRRAYFDCRYGQLHLNYAIPGGGGFDEATPLLCLPGQPGLGRFFVPLLAALGHDRSVYAPDLPGCGESDPPAASLDSGETAHALFDFLDSMHLRRIDLLAHEQGVAVALSMIELRPTHIGRVVFSPGTEAMRDETRALRHPAVVTDLLMGDARDPGELDRQAVMLREFLGLA